MDIELPKTIPKIHVSPKVLKSRNTWAEVFLILFIVILGYWFLIAPKSAQLAASENSLAALQHQNDTLSHSIDALNQLIAKVKGSTQQIAKLDQGLPLTEDSIEVQLLLQSLADSSGLTVNSINVAQASGVVAGNKHLLSNPYGVSRSLQTMPTNISLTGSFDNLQTFLQKLETSGRIFDIISFEIDPAANHQLNLSIYLNAYYFGPNS